MHKRVNTLIFAALLTAGLSGPAWATPHPEHEHRMVIALTTDDFELNETDVSDLEPGDTRTIVTDTGTTIDLLRAENALEVYVDGELLEIGAPELSNIQRLHEDLTDRVEVHCDPSGNCQKQVWIEHDGEIETVSGNDGDETRVVKRVLEIECSDERLHRAAEGSGTERSDEDVHVFHLHNGETATGDAGAMKKVLIRKKSRSD